MKIYIDSREKDRAIQGIVTYFDKHGIAWEKRALATGDYMIEGREGLIIDRKQSLNELATNLLNPKDKARFWREIRRARETNVSLIILCEHGGIKSLADVMKWKSKYGHVTGRSLADAIWRLEVSYNVPVLYCDKRSTGRRIVEILTGQGETSTM